MTNFGWIRGVSGSDTMIHAYACMQCALLQFYAKGKPSRRNELLRTQVTATASGSRCSSSIPHFSNDFICKKIFFLTYTPKVSSEAMSEKGIQFLPLIKFLSHIFSPFSLCSTAPAGSGFSLSSDIPSLKKGIYVYGGLVYRAASAPRASHQLCAKDQFSIKSQLFSLFY